ncbi:MAG: hypothetical protein JKY70_00470 [Mucilaginibacter sp.]|nr:hypothetical protein [Mucilaginibacter sp.]
MQEVRIAARRPLVVIRGDTTVFNARSVKTAPNAMAEDLVKRVRGLTVDANGKLLYNGRPVSKILVDGKPFFGTDGVMALKNIPAALIDKVQLHDMLTAGEKELNEGASPNREKTLNLKLRPGVKFWAAANAAGGTDKRYDAGASGTYSRGTQRISLTGGINNINKLNAGGQPDILALSSGGGITRAAGAAADMQLNIKDIVSYQFQAPHTDQESATERPQTVLGNGALVSGTNGNNRSNSAEYHLFLQRRNSDSALVRRIEFVAGVRRLDNVSRSESNTQQDSRQVNTGSSAYLSKGHQHDLSAIIDLGRRHKGSSWNFQLNVRNSHS